MDKKIGLIGYMGYEVENPIIGGQMSKTRGIYSELIKSFGQDSVIVIDTSNWKAERGKLLRQCWKMARHCSIIIMMPNKNGIKIILPFFSFLKPVMKYRLAYPVVGGWLTDLLRDHRYLARCIKSIDYILPETNALKNELESFASCKMDVMPIFSTRNSIERNKIPKRYTEPFPFCTFSRVTPEKGVDFAIEAIAQVNQDHGSVICTLDVWGPIDTGYEEHYRLLFQQHSDCVTYRGVLSVDDSLEKLANYYMMLFPTYYAGEGFPTVISEAYMAGLPVIASEWRFNGEIVKESETGFLFEAKNVKALKDQILGSVSDSPKIQGMKINCWEISKKFSPQNVMNDLIQWIKNNS